MDIGIHLEIGNEAADVLARIGSVGSSFIKFVLYVLIKCFLSWSIQWPNFCTIPIGM